jgi:hypothetical protein
MKHILASLTVTLLGISVLAGEATACGGSCGGRTSGHPPVVTPPPTQSNNDDTDLDQLLTGKRGAALRQIGQRPDQSGTNLRRDTRRLPQRGFTRPTSSRSRVP